MRERTLWPTLLACTLLLAGFGVAAGRLTQGFEHWTFEALREQQAARAQLRAGAVEVQDAAGTRATLWPAGGTGQPVRLVDFIYTRCPGVCQALGSEYQQMQAALRERGSAAPRVQLLSLSFDTARDGPAELAAYARLHRADPAWWTVAVPARDDAARVLLQRLQVVALPDGGGGWVHNGDIHLIDGHGVLRGLYRYGDWRAALRAAEALARAEAQG